MEFLTLRPARSAGFVLVLTLVIMAILLLGTLAVIRAMTNSNIVAGNFAFREAMLQASDRATQKGLAELQSLVDGGNGNVDVANVYSSRRQAINDLGVPGTIDWSRVACFDETNAVCDQAVDNGRYRMQFYLERQCAPAPAALPDLEDLKSIRSLCDYETVSTTPTVLLALRYRIIVRLQGPRGTAGFVEVMVSGPP